MAEKKSVKKSTTKKTTKTTTKVKKQPTKQSLSPTIKHAVTQPSTHQPALHPYALWGFIASISPLVIAFIPFLNTLVSALPFAGVILSFFGLRKIREEPQKYKGKGFALAGIIIGAIIIALFVIAATIGIFLLLENPEAILAGMNNSAFQ